MPPPKVCPRCGAQYENLKSTTCPQCFAKLVEVDEPFAAELSAARAEVERTPEFQEAKAADDERFREQSFEACLSVALITLVTVVVAVVLIVGAVRHNREAHRTVHSGSPIIGGEGGLVRKGAAPSALPVAAAGIDDVLPPAVGEWHRQSVDSSVTLPGTQVPIFHAVYALFGQSVTVYAVPAGLPTPQENNWTLSVTLSAQGQKQTPLFFNTQYWHYAAVGPNAGTASLRDTLLSQMSR